jgi:hypothetical protein
LGHAFEVRLVGEIVRRRSGGFLAAGQVRPTVRRLAIDGTRSWLADFGPLNQCGERSRVSTPPLTPYCYGKVIRLRDCANIAAAMDGMRVNGGGFAVLPNSVPTFASAGFRTGWLGFVCFSTILAPVVCPRWSRRDRPGAVAAQGVRRRWISATRLSRSTGLYTMLLTRSVTLAPAEKYPVIRITGISGLSSLTD